MKRIIDLMDYLSQFDMKDKLNMKKINEIFGDEEE
tara:strand:- start:45 stop:149 length:105 start_codon:yes stop_codon:yes gene_type:complete